MQTAAITTTAAQRDEAESTREASIIVLTAAELAPCNCPEACERDHDRD
jgi:hypothetical protein